jgi:branched-chain amino acid transport system substrate-binding protein
MNRFALSIVASAAVLLAACGKKEEAPKATAAAPAAAPAPAAPAAPTELVIKIGHVAPTSGTAAHLGKDKRTVRAWRSRISTPRA